MYVLYVCVALGSGGVVNNFSRRDVETEPSAQHTGMVPNTLSDLSIVRIG